MPGEPKMRTWLVEQWTIGLRDAIASMIGDAPKITAGAAEGPVSGDVFWWTQSLGSNNASFSLGASAEAWHTIGNEILKSAGIEDGDDANIKSTYLEIAGQSLSSLARAISGRVRREVVCGEGSESATPPPNGLPVQVEINGAQLTLFAAPSQPLLDLCDASAQAPPKQAAAGAALTAGARTVEDKGYPKGLDLLLDVELPVSVSFGRAEIPIKDVIKLTTGSIVELNRSISEPVEVIVNNVVIARGDVVVVEGNFGVRIKQVVSRQERLRVLR